MAYSVYISVTLGFLVIHVKSQLIHYEIQKKLKVLYL